MARARHEGKPWKGGGRHLDSRRYKNARLAAGIVEVVQAILERCSFSWKRRTALSFYHAIPGKSASRLAWENRCALFLELL
ncbi:MULTISPECIES: hypothetical protein [Rhizobium]|uniref:Uncharacterized protein n=1 Tax=Rhizobium changzhiense TaxID=2692317 RepID=A0A7Z0ZUA2_9HYPH|nr:MULTISPECIES: hypothetical protein [Rhizobium]MBA5802511.1 hypothetical protein [Rhizobium changzhiense]MCH4549016.1 hypothetical protein [Rhizobium changzhiense]MCV9946789.1 hypothetical protein [Rhizobium sp. BT-175]MCW0020644.1 hypothetical protein [Rhizobium sp. BT-226]NZD64432.1 hypothetical protein [Rhizobium changzhiense]